MVASSSAAFFSSTRPSGRPFTNTTISGRRLLWPSMTVNWFTANQSFAAVSSKSTKRTRPPAMVPSGRGYSTSTPSRRSIFPGLVGNLRVQALDGRAQAAHEDHVREAAPLRGSFARRQIGAVGDRIAQIAEPSQGGIFDGGFVEGHAIGRP